MKLKYLIICLLFVSLFSCKKGDSYDVSKLTVLPTFELEPLAVSAKGTTFTPAAVAMEGDKVLPVTIVGSFSTDAVGVYNVGYSAANSDGFTKTAEQTIVVFDPSLTGTNVTGTIHQSNNAARTGTVTLVPGTTNVYYGSDVAFGGVFPLYFQMIGNVLEVIPQQFEFGVTSVTASYDPVGRSISLTVYPQGFAYTMVYN